MRLSLSMLWHPKQLPEVAALVTRSCRETLTRETERLLLRKQSLRVGFCLPGASFALPPHGSYFPQFLVNLKNQAQVKALHPADCRIKSVCFSPFCFSLPSALTDWSPQQTFASTHGVALLGGFTVLTYLCRCALVSGCPEIRRWHLIPWN